MVSREIFDLIREKNGMHASWAVWKKENCKPTSNVGDLSIFEDEKEINGILPILKPDIILAGLNLSRGLVSKKFGNFHDASPRAKDYKIRFALKGSPLWGSYMTDVITDFVEPDSNKVRLSLKKNPQLEEEKVEAFFSEILELSRKPIVFAFGTHAHSLIDKYNRGRVSNFKLIHYAHFISKEDYRKEVAAVSESVF